MHFSRLLVVLTSALSPALALPIVPAASGIITRDVEGARGLIDGLSQRAVASPDWRRDDGFDGYSNIARREDERFGAGQRRDVAHEHDDGQDITDRDNRIASRDNRYTTVDRRANDTSSAPYKRYRGGTIQRRVDDRLERREDVRHTGITRRDIQRRKVDRYNVVTRRDDDADLRRREDSTDPRHVGITRRDDRPSVRGNIVTRREGYEGPAPQRRDEHPSVRYNVITRREGDADLQRREDVLDPGHNGIARRDDRPSVRQTAVARWKD